MTRTMLVLAAAALGCYGTPRTSFPEEDGGAGMGGGATAGSAGTGERAGSGGGAGTGGGISGTGTGGSGSGGSNAVFVGGPCVATPDREAIEVFARTIDGHIHRRAFDGVNWGSWNNIAALDGTLIDARSDLDCSATAGSVHIVASGLNPVGVLLHAFGFGTAYNPFVRELPALAFGPSPSIVVPNDGQIFLGGAPQSLFELDGTASPIELTPITTLTDPFHSGPDVAAQPAGGSGLRYFVAFDARGVLALYYNVISSSGSYWAEPVKLPAPVGTFTFSPAICTENGGFGKSSVNIAAVAGGRLWYARTASITMEAFSSWTMVANDAASSPDCTVIGAESVVHVVVLSAVGTVLDVNGNGTNWVATDLGSPR